MNHRKERFFLEDIVKFCEHIAEYLQDVKEEDFLKNRMLQDALVRKLEIIGEAAKNISSETREENPNVLWKEIARMRDKVIHHYFKVDLDVVWKTSIKDIPVLQAQIEKILESFPEEN
jgi:uncharacterized protein with HEPN domain